MVIQEWFLMWSINVKFTSTINLLAQNANMDFIKLPFMSVDLFKLLINAYNIHRLQIRPSALNAILDTMYKVTPSVLKE